MPLITFKKMPLIKVTEMVYTAVFWLNVFGVIDGISKTLSPRAIVIRLLLGSNLYYKL